MSVLLIPGPIVSVSWLAAHLSHPSLLVLDASLQPVGSASPSDGKTDPSAKRIPGARFFDLERSFSDHASPLPHTMPSPEQFEREARALGVCRESVIVVYDRNGVYSSPRARWMFKAMGHDQVAVLDGGLPAWIEAGLPVEPAETEIEATHGNFIARPCAERICDADQVEAALEIPDECVILDARSEGRFHGREPEPRKGLRPGHMPGALNLPFNAVLSQGRMRDIGELKRILESCMESRAGRDLKLIFSCGSGVTACVSALAAELAGYPAIAIYDGSWAEWGMPSPRPVVGPQHGSLRGLPESARDVIASKGYLLRSIELPAEIRERVIERDWPGLDRAIRKETQPGGAIFSELQNYARFSEIEFIISIRSSNAEPDEDGIWHDDGSRVLAFSLSLTLEPGAIEGGRLEIRKRGVATSGDSEVIPTPPYGTMIVFATGIQGFEHKINRVSSGERIIIAGWCT